jgi:hypothetical protein
VLMHALAASCEELRARTGNPPLYSGGNLGGAGWGATASPPTFTENCRIFGNFDRKEGQKQSFRVQMRGFVGNLKVLSEI